MSNLEEKILEGPRVHYCDDGDDDIRQDANDSDDNELGSGGCRIETGKLDILLQRPDDEAFDANRSRMKAWTSEASRNTGPKGVLADFKKKSQDDELEAEFQALLRDEGIIKELAMKRIQSNIPIFGQVYRLGTGSQLLDAIDKENPNVLVIVHLYTRYSRPCSHLNGCLDELASDLKTIKFVTLDASVTGLSQNFKENGVPALLAYRGGDLVKSIIQLSELLDRDFTSNDVKDILSDNGLINKQPVL